MYYVTDGGGGGGGGGASFDNEYRADENDREQFALTSFFTYVVFGDTDFEDDGAGLGTMLRGADVSDDLARIPGILRIGSVREAHLRDPARTTVPVMLLGTGDVRDVPRGELVHDRRRVVDVLHKTAVSCPDMPSNDWVFARFNASHALAGGIYKLLADYGPGFHAGADVRALVTRDTAINMQVKDCTTYVPAEKADGRTVDVKCSDLYLESYYVVLLSYNKPFDL
jgi:hypothetical protein